MESHDSLPYIDPDITQADRDAVNKIIRRELPAHYQNHPHPSLTPLPTTKFPESIQQELARHAAKQPRTGGIDMSRYEAPDEPTGDADVDEWKSALKEAYISSTYLSGRRVNLALLDEYGKNAWLIGNYQLEGLLKRLETELADVKAQTEEVNRARKIAQEDSRGELIALEDTWKKGIGKIIEVQVATEQLRIELSQRRRAAAG